MWCPLEVFELQFHQPLMAWSIVRGDTSQHLEGTLVIIEIQQQVHNICIIHTFVIVKGHLLWEWCGCLPTLRQSSITVMQPLQHLISGFRRTYASTVILKSCQRDAIFSCLFINSFPYITSPLLKDRDGLQYSNILSPCYHTFPFFNPPYASPFQVCTIFCFVFTNNNKKSYQVSTFLLTGSCLIVYQVRPLVYLANAGDGAREPSAWEADALSTDNGPAPFGTTWMHSSIFASPICNLNKHKPMLLKLMLNEATFASVMALPNLVAPDAFNYNPPSAPASTAVLP